MLTMENVLALRMQRQYFDHPAGPEDYDGFFRDVSPVPTIGWCEPGLPPTLPPHAGFDDGLYNGQRRAKRQILKGRFGGKVAYVTRGDLELYACLYRKPISKPTYEQERMLDLLAREGPLNIGTIKELTGLLVKEITPILHKLQEAFLVYEDQLDKDGDRGWYIFSSEFPDVDLERYNKIEALRHILPRFAYRHVFFTEEMAKSFYKQPLSAIRSALEGLVQDGQMKAAVAEGVSGYMLPDDLDNLSKNRYSKPSSAMMGIQRNDFLVKSLESRLQDTFRSESDMLYYLLFEGDLHGAVCGRFKFGPHVLKEILLELPESECRKRSGEVLSVVETQCGIPIHQGEHIRSVIE